MAQKNESFLEYLRRKLGITEANEALYFTYGFTGLILVGFGAYWLGHNFLGGKEIQRDKRRKEVLRWGPSRGAGSPSAMPWIAKVNKVAGEDYVGLFDGSDPRGVYVGAFDGKTGKMIWRQGPYKIASFRRDSLAIVGKYVVVRTRNDSLVVLRLRTGKRVRSLPMLPRGPRLCVKPGSKSWVFVGGRGRKGERVNIKTGKRMDSPSPRWCKGVKPRGPRSPIKSGSKLFDWQKGWSEMIVGKTYVATIKRKGGRGTLQIYSKSGQLQWQRLESRLYGCTRVDLRHIEVHGDRVYVSCRRQAKRGLSTQLLALSAKSLKLLWRHKYTSLEGGIVATDKRVYHVNGRELFVLKAKNGKQLGVLGDNG